MAKLHFKILDFDLNLYVGSWEKHLRNRKFGRFSTDQCYKLRRENYTGCRYAGNAGEITTRYFT